MPKEEKTELIEPKPEGLGEVVSEKKEAEKPDPLKELEARLRGDFEKAIKERDDEIRSLRKATEKPVTQPGPTVVEKIDIYEDLGTKIWENTPAALKTLRDEIKKEVTAELKGAYRAEKSEEKFWDDFYRHNKTFDRDEDHWVVQSVVQENFAAWKDMPVSKVRDELAKETTKRLARLEARKDRGGDSKAPTLTLQSASAHSPKKEPEEEKPKTLSQMIREKQQMRQTALFKRQVGRDEQGRFRKDVN